MKTWELWVRKHRLWDENLQPWVIPQRLRCSLVLRWIVHRDAFVWLWRFKQILLHSNIFFLSSVLFTTPEIPSLHWSKGKRGWSSNALSRRCIPLVSSNMSRLVPLVWTQARVLTTFHSDWCYYEQLAGFHLSTSKWSSCVPQFACAVNNENRFWKNPETQFCFLTSLISSTECCEFLSNKMESNNYERLCYIICMVKCSNAVPHTSFCNDIYSTAHVLSTLMLFRLKTHLFLSAFVHT